MFSTFERIKELAKSRGITLGYLEEKLNLSRNSIYTIKNKKPSAERLQMIAEYFNVSTDYLLGRTDNPRVASDSAKDFVDEQEQQALVMFRKETEDLSEEDKVRFNKALAGLMKSARNIIKDDF